MAMRELSYRLQFLTPAFLGDANQSGCWRTPPIKALLRQWWRVAYAAERRFDVNVASMRNDEGQLFGTAADRGSSKQSAIRIRLSQWSQGQLTSWAGLDSVRVTHPEVPKAVGAHLYLGYGPLISGQSGSALKKAAAIQADEHAELRLAVPDSHANVITTALWLMDRYGTLGGRSRNGWGSFSLSPNDRTPPFASQLDAALLRNWEQAIKLDWPHALGADSTNRPLVWQTPPVDDWKMLMKRFAEIKIGLRTQFLFTTGHNAARPEARHWLSYPVTKHSVQSWGNNDRLPSSLRFKARRTAEGKKVGVIFHIPCSPPSQFRPEPTAIREVWRRTHGLLDELTRPQSSRAYATISDQERRDVLRKQLDPITLERVSA